MRSVRAGIAILLAGQSTPVLIVAMIVGGAVLGAAWGAIPGLLRAFLRTNEIITSLMLNYVAALVLNYLIFDSLSYWRDTSATGSSSRRARRSSTRRPGRVTTIGSVAIPFGFLVAIAVAVVIWVLYTRTRFGFEAQVIGDSPRAARYAGMRTRRKIVAIMCLSGAIAGIGGASQIGDFRHVLDARGLQQANYGYTGIVVAALARYNPFAVVLVAFLLGGLQNAGYTLQSADFPSGLVGVMQGMILFAMLGGELLVQYRISLARPVRHARRADGVGRVNSSIVVVVLASAVAYGTPLLYAALGELLAERSGVLNLGVEGMMLVGAVMGFLAVQRIGGPEGVVLPLAIAVAALAGRGRRAGPRLPRDHAACEPDRLGPRADDPLRRGRALVVHRQRLRARDRPGAILVRAGQRLRPRGSARRRPDRVRADLARLRLVGLRRRSSASTCRGPGPGSTCGRSASRPRPPTRWGSASRGTATSTRSPAARSRVSGAPASASR